jgi:hypothetical protein
VKLKILTGPGTAEQLKRDQVKGLGDLVAKVAKPIAKTLDAALKTKLAECKSCEERQKVLNEFLKFN